MTPFRWASRRRFAHDRGIARMAAAGDAGGADARQQRGVIGKTLAKIGVQIDGSLGHSSRSPAPAASKSASSIGSKRNPIPTADREMTLFQVQDRQRRCPAQQVPATGRHLGINPGLPSGHRDRAGRHRSPRRLTAGQAAQGRRQVARAGEPRQEPECEAHGTHARCAGRSSSSGAATSRRATSSRSGPSYRTGNRISRPCARTPPHRPARRGASIRARPGRSDGHQRRPPPSGRP